MASERVAIVGSRAGADLEHVEAFVRELWAKYPDTIIVSGGARGVDKVAETTWLELGGRVESFRPVMVGPDEYAIEKWELGGPQPRVYVLMDWPTWADYGSAANSRNILIADACDRLVLFHKPRWRGGGGMTEEIARLAYQRPTYVYEAGLAKAA